LAAHGKFGKLIYNDVDGDLVNLFRVISDHNSRQSLLKILRWLPPSRRVFNDDHDKYVAAGFSFSACPDPIERARRTFYRHCFAFGGKVRCGGFAVSTNDDDRIKEVARYRNNLRKMVRVGNLFRDVLIENLHYQELLQAYGQKEHICFYVDPPYHGTEDCYSRTFGSGDHTFLAHQLEAMPAPVVCSYYDTPLIRSLYPESRWNWQSIAATKNCCLTRGNKVVTNEFVITKKS
jgi:DNA adenine methylase